MQAVDLVDGRNSKRRDVSDCTCRHCSVKLIPLSEGGNWEPSRQKRREYTCIDCRRERQKLTIFINGKRVKRTDPMFEVWFNQHGFGTFWTEHTVSDIPSAKLKSDEGYVYAFTNPYWFSKGWLKIGKAEDKEQRLGNYQTYTPLRDYYEFHSIKVSNRTKSETLAHNMIESMEGCIDRKEEWFRFKDTEAITKAVEIMNRL